MERYEDLGVIGSGGMGEVRRVRDRVLDRVIAMKVVRADIVEDAALARFAEEAQVTARLQHPGIVAVHDSGRLPDGRAYFTMKEVRGRTLGDVMGEWTFRRVVDAFHKACEAVAYAHAQGVVHRDLKPANIMVGEFGEVQVMDWGLAKVLGRPTEGPGQIAGTPAYMPPEQARGELDRIDARSDVYSLGAVLYEILAGRPAYGGGDTRAVLLAVLSGPPAPPDSGAGPPSATFAFGLDEVLADTPVAPPPAELVAVCRKAMSREQADRHADAQELAQEMAAWLDGSHKRDQALAVVDEGLAMRVAATDLRERAATARAEGAALLSKFEASAPIDRKRPGWEREDDADRLEREAAEKELEAERRFHAAFTHAPDLQEGHAALTALYRDQHARAEAAREPTAARYARLLQAHNAALPPRNPDAIRHAAYLKGDGALTLVTDPPGAEASLFRFERVDRRLVAVFERSLGTTPLFGARLPMGSWLVKLAAPGRAEVSYPVHVRREEHWDGLAPGSPDAHPIRLPLPVEVGDDVYVPAGFFQAGGDPNAVNALAPARIWLDGFAVQRHPITHAGFIAFLNDLIARGRRDEAAVLAPKMPPGPLKIGDIYRHARTGFSLPEAGPFSFARADAPVFLIDLAAALQFAEWAAKKTGMAWKLMGDLEFEKAARGVDGRAFPWGDFLDPSWCAIAESGTGGVPSRIGEHPGDESVYGARGLAGNVRTWCREPFAWTGPPVVGGRATEPSGNPLEGAGTARGGYSFGDARYSRCATRDWILPFSRDPSMGIRLVRPLG